MKTTLLLVRHGQSIGNLYERFLGHTDLGLSPLGLRQAEALVDGLRGIEIDVVYSSDLSRAMQTVTPAATVRALPVIPERRLREIYAGEWENVTFDGIAERWPEERRLWKTDIGRSCPVGGESVAALYDRVAAVLDELAARHPGKTVLIGTHATPVRATRARLAGTGAIGMADIAWAPNASVTTVVYEDGVPYLAEADRVDHLAGIVTLVPSKI